MLACFVFFAAFYFHLTNVCGFTSTVPCMRSEMQEALMRYNATYREFARHKEGNYDEIMNMTRFFEEEADIFVYRIISDSPEQRFYMNGNYSNRHSRSLLSHKVIYLSPNGDIVQYKGNNQAEY